VGGGGGALIKMKLLKEYFSSFFNYLEEYYYFDYLSIHIDIHIFNGIVPNIIYAPFCQSNHSSLRK
jgi:hypothetical protein